MNRWKLFHDQHAGLMWALPQHGVCIAIYSLLHPILNTGSAIVVVV